MCSTTTAASACRVSRTRSAATGPGLPSGALHPDSVGVRPKIYREGEPVADFAIHGPAQHGVPRLVALYGMESPGLTSSLAIGDYVAALLADGRAKP